jgi:hypothetical protein
LKWTEILTAIVAAYGAILATLTFIYQWRLSRPRVEVDIQESLVFPFLGNPTNVGEPFGPVVSVSPRNMGQKKVVLHSWGFTINRNEESIMVTQPSGLVEFPYELLPDSSCSLWVPAKQLAERLHSQGISGKVKLSGYVEDAVKRRYRSKPMKFDVHLARIGAEL